MITNNLETISRDLKTEYKEDDNNISTCNKLASEILQLNKNDMNNLFKKLSNNKSPDLYFNYFCIVAELKRNQLRNCEYLFIGQPYSLLIDIINKYFSNNLNNQNSDIENKEKQDLKQKILSIDEYKKLSVKERVQINKDQFDMNSINSIYEDFKKYIQNKIEENKKSGNKVSENADFLYKKFALDEFDEYMCKRILENNDIFTGILIVRKERLDDLYEKLNEYNKNI